MKKIILIGDGGHAHACIDVIEQCKKYSIAGFIVKKIWHPKYFWDKDVLSVVEVLLKRMLK